LAIDCLSIQPPPGRYIPLVNAAAARRAESSASSRQERLGALGRFIENVTAKVFAGLDSGGCRREAEAKVGTRHAVSIH
jgi:hypothetical protein